MKSQLVDKAEVEFFERVQSLLDSEHIRPPKNFSKICGVDAAYSAKDNQVVAVAVLFDNGVLNETSSYFGKFTFSYISGLFFLHEGPFAVAAVGKLKNKPQLVCFDAHGIAHPRSKGLATVCGMVLGIPSVGIAKRALVGKTVQYREGLDKLRYNDEDVGFITTYGGKRVWSPGYSVDLKELEAIISHYGETCVQAMREAHELSRRSIINLAT